MAVNQSFPLYNGIAPSWADLIVRVSGTSIQLADVEDIKSIDTSRTVEVGKQRGATGGRIKKRTLGSLDQDGSLTFYKDGYVDFIAALVAAAEAQGFTRGNEVLISPVVFDVQYLFTPFGATRVFDRRMIGCRVIGDTSSASEGTDAAEVEVPLDIMKICDMVNGKEVVLL
jgi:hypothetical protein